ncbi:MAG: hypothetical protein EZS28_043462, partial [Streblomastix strix]
MADSSNQGDNIANISQMLKRQINASGDIKTQFIQCSGLLKLTEINDERKIQALENIILLSVTLEYKDWQGVIKTGIIDCTSSLMLETTNPRIRTLCGGAILILQQIGTEPNGPVDWKTLFAPLLQLLFSADETISKIGKQTLLDIIEKNPDSISALVALDLFDSAANALDASFPDYSSHSQSSSSQIKVSQSILINILEFVEKVLRSDADIQGKTLRLLETSERIKQLLLPKQIKLAVQSILLVLQQEGKVLLSDRAANAAMQHSREVISEKEKEINLLVQENAKLRTNLTSSASS